MLTDRICDLQVAAFDSEKPIRECDRIVQKKDSSIPLGF